MAWRVVRDAQYLSDKFAEFMKQNGIAITLLKPNGEVS